jgi:hypothetical protein
VSVFYEMKVHICGIILVLDRPRDGVGCGQVGGVIDEGLDDCDLLTHLSPPRRDQVKIMHATTGHTFDSRASSI